MSDRTLTADNDQTFIDAVADASVITVVADERGAIDGSVAVTLTTKPNVKYPTIVVWPIDGNAWSIMACVKAGMQEAGIDPAEFRAYQDEAMSGDYDHLIRTTQAWVNLENGDM